MVMKNIEAEVRWTTNNARNSFPGNERRRTSGPSVRGRRIRQAARLRFCCSGAAQMIAINESGTDLYIWQGWYLFLITSYGACRTAVVY